MIWIPAAIVGLLVLVAVAMIIRVFVAKREKEMPLQAIEKVKTEVVDIEPQFVLEGDETNNIFARSSNAFALGDAIEKSEVTKPGTANSQKKRKTKTKKIVIRKRKQNEADTVQGSAAGDGEDRKNDSDIEDGFGDNNASNFSPDASRTSSFNSSQRIAFMASQRDNLVSPKSVSTTTKLKSIALHRVDEDM